MKADGQSSSPARTVFIRDVVHYYMKLPILIFTIFISFSVLGQDKRAIELQIQWHQKAENSLDSSKIRSAFYEYHFSHHLIPESDLGKTSKAKSDSLKNILRDTLLQNLKGTWKLKIFGKINSKEEKDHYEKLGRYLTIRNDSIFYYKNKINLEEQRPSQIHKIEFSDLETIYPNYSDIIHSDNQIWNYSVDSKKNNLIIEENGELSPDGKSRSEVISHPSGYTYIRIK